MESRHPDIIELDAASHTGIDDIREIIENARYKPIAARYKVFIIDEVHMLSKNAFNGLLKTLEEPPEHVKFVFATTEIRKVPITILSRCQRFDLRRVDVPVLIKHFQKILSTEAASADDDALRLIARAAEGSVRDGLSILDQSIAMGQSQPDKMSEVKAADVRAMLGLADRSRIFDLLELVLGAKPGPAIQALAKLHRDGAEPLQVLADLSEAVHLVTRTKIVGTEAVGEQLSAEERARSTALAGQVSVPILARAWQMLVKGLEEAGKAGNPLAAAEMVLIRLAYTADLPTPDELIRSLGGGPVRTGVATPPAPTRDAPQRGPMNVANRAQPLMTEHEPPPVASYEDYGSVGPDSDFAPPEDDDQAEIDADIGPAMQAPSGPAVVRTFTDVVDLASRRRDARLKVMLEENVSLVRFDAEQGLIDIHLLANAPKELGNELREKLNAWTERKWMVALASRPGAPAIAQVLRDQAARELETLKAHPAVAEVLRQFPQAKITTVKVLPRTKTDESQTG
jgi:DNA polymerase III subunit gamma/tau